MTKREKETLAAGVIEVSSLHGGPQRVRTGPRGRKRFNAAAKQRFLDALTLTCNVEMSADHAGFQFSTVYRARSHDPVFDRQWRDALEMGLERLELQLVEHGGAGLPLEDADHRRALAQGAPPFDFDKALRALQYYAKFRMGVAPRSGVLQPRAEDTDAAITKLLVRLDRRAATEPGLMLPAPDTDGDREADAV